MAMIIQCPQCSARYRIDPGAAPGSSVRVKCPKCSAVITAQLAPPPVEAPSPPVAAPPAAESSKSRVEDAVASNVAGLSEQILVIDDSRFFRELILDLLKPLGIPCLTAGSAEEALEIIVRERPRLLLLDLNLPGKNGYELIREIRAMEQLKNIRIMAMSGVFRKETDVAEAEVAGADDFLSKSFKPEQLHIRINRLYTMT